MRKLRYYILRRSKSLVVFCFLSSFLLFALTGILSPHNKTTKTERGAYKAVISSYSSSNDQFEVQEKHIVQVTQAPMLPATSKCTFYKTFEENLNKLASLEFEESKEMMEDLGFNRIPPQPNTNTSFPVIAAGYNSGYFDIAQGLIKSVHENLMPVYPALKLIIYDLGLSDSQAKRLRKYCRCEVRAFPFDQLPSHFRRLRSYAFKPVIANMVFQEFGSVWWVDASARFVKKSMELPIAYLRENGALFFTYDKSLNVALHTHSDTFAYFREEPCAYKDLGEIEAGNVAFLNNHMTRTILRLWASCALIENCISPRGALLGCPRVRTNDVLTVGACHRFDQSLLSIILRRLYHKQNDYPEWEAPFRYMSIQRGHRVDYLPND